MRWQRPRACTAKHPAMAIMRHYRDACPVCCQNLSAPLLGATLPAVHVLRDVDIAPTNVCTGAHTAQQRRKLLVQDLQRQRILAPRVHVQHLRHKGHLHAHGCGHRPGLVYSCEPLSWRLRRCCTRARASNILDHGIEPNAADCTGDSRSVTAMLPAGVCLLIDAHALLLQRVRQASRPLGLAWVLPCPLKLKCLHLHCAMHEVTAN